MSVEGLCLISKTLAPSGDDWTVSVWKTESFLKFVVRCDYREPCPYYTAHGALCLKDVMNLIDQVFYEYQNVPGSWRGHVGRWLAAFCQCLLATS